MRNCLLFLAVLFSVAAHSNVVHEERSLYRNIIVDETHDLRCLKFNTKSSQTSQNQPYLGASAVILSNLLNNFGQILKFQLLIKKV